MSNTSSNTPLPSRIEIRQITQDGVTIDGVWIPHAFLEELAEQGVYDSQFGSSLGADRDVIRVLEARGLLERETRGGVHRGPALAEWMDGLEWPERERDVLSNTSSTPSSPACPVSGDRCTRNCENSPENPELAGLCERLGFAPMQPAFASAPSVSGSPEAEPLVPVDGGEFGKFHVGGWNGESCDWYGPVNVRCWICGSSASSGAGGDAVALEDLAAWARSHVCPPLQVNGGGCDR